MIPVWLIAAIALLGAVCLALPLHIGMTGVCLLLLAAVLLALRILRKKDAPRVWSRILIALTAVSMAVIFGAMVYISVQGKDSAMTPDETPDFIVVLGGRRTVADAQKASGQGARIPAGTPGPDRDRLRRAGPGRSAHGSVGHGAVPARARRRRIADP